MAYDHLTIISGRAHPELAREISEYLGIKLAAIEIGDFPDGEISVKLNQNIRGCDVFIVQPTGPPVNRNIMELLILIDTCRRASAARITAVLPYFGYARQDRKDEGRVPITAKLVANLITAARADRVLALDLHAAQIQGFFNYFKSLREELGDLCLVSPDVGNVKVAEGFANMLGGDLAIINKRRLSGSSVTTGNLIGSVSGKTVLMYDDMISTAGTVCEAARLVMDKGAKRVIAAATHGVLVGM